jgi:type II secretory pathway pseudopilin PulG
LFSIGDADITTGTLTATGIVLIVIGVLVFAVMSFIAWRKREAIKKGARRASDYVRRASQKLRASISGNRPSEGGEEKAQPVNNVNKDMLEM